MEQHSNEKTSRLQYARHYARGYLKGLWRRVVEKVDIRLGVELWPLDLADPAEVRRPWKVTRAARFFGRALFWAQHRHAPRPEGCACERTGSQEEAVA